MFSKKTMLSIGLAGTIAFGASAVANAAIVTFDFTGRLTVVNSIGDVIGGGSDGYTPISAQLILDTGFVTSGPPAVGAPIGTSTLNVVIDDLYLGYPGLIHDMQLTYGGGVTLRGDFMGDWNGNFDMPAKVTWDANGLATAAFFGLQVGDVLSGNKMYRGGNEVISDLGSATPYADTLDYSFFPAFTLQGPAPMAATSASPGFTSGPFTGLRVLIDIGSGNSMTVTAVNAVPVPAAVWLFGSGLLGLIGVARRKAHTA